MSGQSDQTGFSLVEIVIVVGMLATLATITMINFKGNTIQDRVQSSANIVQSNLTLARTYARTGKTCCNNQNPNGYGIFLNSVTTPAKVIVYANFNDVPEYDSASDVVIATAPIDERVEFNSPISNFTFAMGNDTTVFMDGEDWIADGTITIILQDKATHTITKPVTLYYPSALIDQSQP